MSASHIPSPTVGHLAAFDGPALLATLSPPFGACPYRNHDTTMAAAILSSTPKSLEAERCRRRLKIPTIRIGRKVLYREADLMAFLDRCRTEG